MTSTYDQGKKTGQNNPNQQNATPQEIPNVTERENFNKGLGDGQKK